MFLAFLLVGARTVVSAQSSESLEAAWVKEDIASVAIVLKLVPFGNQSISLLKARFADQLSHGLTPSRNMRLQPQPRRL